MEMKLHQFIDRVTLTQKQLHKCSGHIADYFMNDKITKKELTENITKVVGSRSVARDIVKVTTA